MGWTISLLIVAAIILFILSMYKTKQSSNNEQREIDMVYMTLMEDIKKLQNEVQILNIENDMLAQKIGFDHEERELQRKLLELYTKNFSIELIASRLHLEPSEVERLLAPFESYKNEGSNVANES